MTKKHKTRQAKIISDLRRKLSQQAVARPQKALEEQENPNYQLRNLPTTQPKTRADLPMYPVALVKKDLTKTAILTVLAISFELVLYFLLG